MSYLLLRYRQTPIGTNKQQSCALCMYKTIIHSKKAQTFVAYYFVPNQKLAISKSKIISLKRSRYQQVIPKQTTLCRLE